MTCNWLYFFFFLTNLPLYFLLATLVFQRDKHVAEIMFLQDFILENCEREKVPQYFPRKQLSEKRKEESASLQEEKEEEVEVTCQEEEQKQEEKLKEE